MTIGVYRHGKRQYSKTAKKNYTQNLSELDHTVFNVNKTTLSALLHAGMSIIVLTLFPALTENPLFTEIRWKSKLLCT